MSGTQALVQRILQDAEATCKQILSKSQQEADEIVKQARQQIADQQAVIELQALEEGKETDRRRMSVANLDARKSQLYIKQQLVDKAYLEAKRILLDDDVRYLAFISSMLMNNADNGEVVSICRRDASRITQQFLDGLGKNLKLADTYVNIDGGVIISMSAYEKNLSIDLLLRQSREKSESKVVQILFEG
ncbi:MAG: V-type ATP synthase subunit E [Clostridia bacterium]|nr:V-type ATP synthase subunit E [Clostridia bacterium]